MGQPEGMYIPITLRDVYMQQQDLARQIGALQASYNVSIAEHRALQVGQERELAAANVRIEQQRLDIERLEKEIVRIDKQPVVRPQAVWAGAGLLATIVSVVVSIVRG